MQIIILILYGASIYIYKYILDQFISQFWLMFIYLIRQYINYYSLYIYFLNIYFFLLKEQLIFPINLNKEKFFI